MIVARIILASIMRYDIGRLQRARREKGLCLKDLAKICRLSASTIGRTEAGEIEGPRTIKAMADALGVPMSEVIIQNDVCAEKV